MNNGWISVKERLPESEETVLICAYSEEDHGWCYITGNYFDLDDDDDDGWYFHDELMHDEGFKAIAWMPITPYNKEESK